MSSPKCLCVCLNLCPPEFPRVHSHHSHQSHLADQDPSAAGDQVRNLPPSHVRCTRWCASFADATIATFPSRNRGERRMNAFECVRRVYQMDGLRGFYRGMSASYAGISETVIHFVIYESIKRKLLESKVRASMDEDEEVVRDASDFVGMMLAAATSKTCATSIAYPHGNCCLLSHCRITQTSQTLTQTTTETKQHGGRKDEFQSVSPHPCELALVTPTQSNCCIHCRRVQLSPLDWFCCFASQEAS